LPVSIKELDKSSKQDNITVLLGKKVILNIIEKPYSKRLLDDTHVKRFISLPNLCRESRQQQLTHFFQVESRFRNTCINESRLRHNINDVTSLVENKKFCLKHLEDLRKNVNLEELRKKEDEHSIEKYRLILYQQDQLERTMYDLSKITRRKKSKLTILNEQTFSAGKELEKELGLAILTAHTYIFCPDCGTLISSEEYESEEKCARCERQIKRKDAEYVEVHIANDKIREVWESRLWFEAYVSELLKKLNWQTWTHVLVMGSSGIYHQIDFLAIKGGSVIVGECKTGRVSRNDVFNFVTKADDIKAHFSIYAMLNGLPETETREFIRKDPSVIMLENLCKLEEDAIIEELDKRLLLKT